MTSLWNLLVYRSRKLVSWFGFPQRLGFARYPVYCQWFPHKANLMASLSCTPACPGSQDPRRLRTGEQRYGPHVPNSLALLVLIVPSGGDGLVAARHLRHYGYQPTVFYPKKSKNDLYQVGTSCPCVSYRDLSHLLRNSIRLSLGCFTATCRCLRITLTLGGRKQGFSLSPQSGSSMKRVVSTIFACCPFAPLQGLSLHW